MKYLGIDYGTKRVGLAVSNEDIAFPRGTLPNDEQLLSDLRDLIGKERIQCIVVGDTRSISGAGNAITDDAEAFMEHLRNEIGIEVKTVNEAGSSVAVAVEGEEKRDDAAAAFILQRFLDMKGKME